MFDKPTNMMQLTNIARSAYYSTRNVYGPVYFIDFYLVQSLQLRIFNTLMDRPSSGLSVCVIACVCKALACMLFRFDGSYALILQFLICHS